MRRVDRLGGALARPTGVSDGNCVSTDEGTGTTTDGRRGRRGGPWDVPEEAAGVVGAARTGDMTGPGWLVAGVSGHVNGGTRGRAVSGPEAGSPGCSVGRRRAPRSGRRTGCRVLRRVVPKSPSITEGGGAGYTGTYCLRNFLFRSVTLPEPSTRITYWSNCRTSTTTPVLSHLRGWGPIWFCTRTWSPTVRGGSRLVCSDQRSALLMWRFRSASSRAAKVSPSAVRLVFAGRHWNEVPNRMAEYAHGGRELGFPVRRVPVLKHRTSASVSRAPVGLVLSRRRRLMVFTPISARQLLWGYATEERR